MISFDTIHTKHVSMIRRFTCMENNKNHFFIILSAIFALIAMAAGVAFFVYKVFGDKKSNKNYIECECEPEYT